MQEKESIMAFRCELKISSLGKTVRHHSASIVIPNSYYLFDGTFLYGMTGSEDLANVGP